MLKVKDAIADITLQQARPGGCTLSHVVCASLRQSHNCWLLSQHGEVKR